jgi:hypothetical protein
MKKLLVLSLFLVSCDEIIKQRVTYDKYGGLCVKTFIKESYFSFDVSDCNLQPNQIDSVKKKQMTLAKSYLQIIK